MLLGDKKWSKNIRKNNHSDRLHPLCDILHPGPERALPGRSLGRNSFPLQTQMVAISRLHNLDRCHHAGLLPADNRNRHNGQPLHSQSQKIRSLEQCHYGSHWPSCLWTPQRPHHIHIPLAFLYWHLVHHRRPSTSTVGHGVELQRPSQSPSNSSNGQPLALHLLFRNGSTRHRLVIRTHGVNLLLRT